MPNNYEVGYGKSPVQNRWIPGCKSPNPAGSPRGSKSLYTLLNKIANEENSRSAIKRQKNTI